MATKRLSDEFRDVETLPVAKKKVLHTVKHVYLHIPADSSATECEIDIEGCLEVQQLLVSADTEVYLEWSPVDLTHRDVACLYAAESDAWTLVDENVLEDSAEVVEDTPRYNVTNIDAPEPIIEEACPMDSKPLPPVTPAKRLRSSSNLSSTSVASSRIRYEIFFFPLKQLHSIRESNQDRPVYPHLLFFLKDGKALPTLHFHDGGIAQLLTMLSPRYIFLRKNFEDALLYDVVDNLAEFKQSQRQQKIRANLSTSDVLAEGLKSDAKEVKKTVLTGAGKVTNAFKKLFFSERELIDTPRQPVVVETKEMQKHLPTNPEFSVFGDYDMIHALQIPERPLPQPRHDPLGRLDWEKLRDINGRISSENQELFISHVFYRGLHSSIRMEAWQYLLGYMPYDMSDTERMQLRREKEEQYYEMKKQWKSFLPIQIERFRSFRESEVLINKDVYRTDREVPYYKESNAQSLVMLQDILTTYVMYNMDLGYVQGMSDMLAPILFVMEGNEVNAFWCFAGLMEQMMRYFELTQAHTKERIKKLRTLVRIICPEFYQLLVKKKSDNLYFCFRWLLVAFKREFVYEDVMKIWEVIWTNRLSVDYGLFIALAILDKESQEIMSLGDDIDFSDILKHINGLAFHMNADDILSLAETYVMQLYGCTDLPDEVHGIINDPLPLQPENAISDNSVVKKSMLLLEMSQDDDLTD